MNKLQEDALKIMNESIREVLPEAAVKKALGQWNLDGKNIYMVSIGKAAWRMASTVAEICKENLMSGIIVTKYGHSKGDIPKCEVVEAGHPIPDENSLVGGKKTLELIKKIKKDDILLFLVSGGGSSLFESPLPGVSLIDIMDITEKLLASGANIVEINTIRKHLSAVKGGRLAQLCDGQIFSVVLSDVIGDRLDSIASGPAYADDSTSEDALRILSQYDIEIVDEVRRAILQETPKEIKNVETVISGSVKAFCKAAANTAKKLGYFPLVLTTSLECEAKEAGKFLGDIVKEIKSDSGSLFNVKLPCAIIAGGETVVRLIGNGKGGRNQELALSAALVIDGIENAVILSVGSDGTDGPTDAAGGLVDGGTANRIRAKGRIPEVELDNNNAYHALESSGDLLITGATGTNVNDLVFVLCE